MHAQTLSLYKLKVCQRVMELSILGIYRSKHHAVFQNTYSYEYIVLDMYCHSVGDDDRRGAAAGQSGDDLMA